MSSILFFSSSLCSSIINLLEMIENDRDRVGIELIAF
jgi:hypothetical protein